MGRLIAAALLGCSPRLPSAQVEGVSLTSLGLEAASAEVAVAVDNPLWVDVPLEGWRWEVTVAGRPIGRGVSEGASSLAADARTSVVVPVEIVYADLWAAFGAAGDAAPYTVAVELDLATPRGPLTLPLTHEGTLPRLEPPSIDVVALRPGLDGARMVLEVELAVGLPPGLTLEALRFAASVDGAEVGSGEASVGESGRLVVPLVLDGWRASAATWAAAWGEAESLTLALDGRVGTPLGSVPVSLVRQIALGQQPGLAAPGEPRSPAP